MKEEKMKLYKPEDVEESLNNHPEFDRVCGTYILSINSVTLGPDKGIHFHCSKESFDNFISQLVEGLISFSFISSEKIPISWVPFPGISREQLLTHYPPEAELELKLIASDPNIILIKKVADTGRQLTWDILDGRIGHGGFTFISPPSK